MSTPTIILGILLAVFFLSTVLMLTILPILQRKKMGQTILEIGPSWHKSKQGTPTMGGLAPALAILLVCGTAFLLPGFIRGKIGISVLLTLLYALGNGAVGVADDLTKFRKHQNGGLTPLQKLVCQFALAGAYLALLTLYGAVDTSLTIPFSARVVPLGYFYYPLGLLFLVGTVNCVNLTDGIDGLATSVNLMVSSFFAYYAFVRAADGLLLLSVCMMGASLSFLLFNYRPARVFMGDTGSLFFGGLAGGLAILSGSPLLLGLCGGVYFIEGASVILQVLWFKISGGKRLFKMAPFHHHLEKQGWTEEKIVFVMTLLSLLGAVLAAFG